MTPPPAKRLVILHLAGIGDLLMGRRALQAIRTAYPASRIALVTFRKTREVAALIPGVDERYVLEEGWSLGAAIRNLWTVMQLRRGQFDLAVHLYQVYRPIGVLKLAVLLRLIGAARTIGRDTDGKGWCFDQKIPERSADSLHEVERQCAFVQQLGCPVPDAAEPLLVDPRDQQAAEQWLRERDVAPQAVLIGVHAGGARLGHRWPWRAFSDAAQELEQRYGARILLTGNRAERGVVNQIASRLAHPLIAAGELSFGQMACLLQRCRLFLTNDSGPMHLAAALDVPLVAVVGPTDPTRYGPYPLTRPRQRILHAMPCAPCYRFRCAGHEALARVPVRVVVEAARAILDGQPSSGIVQVSMRKRVLHIHTLPVISGSGLNTWYSMCGQRDAGYEVELACAGGGQLLDLVRQQGMGVHELRHMVRSVHPLHDVLVIGELWQLMRRGRYHLIHTHNSKAGIVGRIAAKLAGVPVVVHTYHSCVFAYPHLPRWRRYVFLWMERAVTPLTDYFIVISEALHEAFVAAKITPPDRVAVIYSGIEVTQFQQAGDTNGLRHELGLSPQDIVLGTVARLDVGKGHEELLDVMARVAPRYAQVKLLCIGDGPLRAHLDAQIQRRGLRDCVRLVGERRDIAQLTHVFDIAVLASHYEGMGRVLLEAQAAGKPVVATRAGGIPDIVNDGETGYLVPPGASDAFAAAVERLVADAALRQRMGAAAARWVTERFSSRRMCEQIQALYARLV